MSEYDDMLTTLRNQMEFGQLNGIHMVGPKLPWHWRWKWIKWIHRWQIKEFEAAMKRAKPYKPQTHFLGVRIATDDGKPLL